MSKGLISDFDSLFGDGSFLTDVPNQVEAFVPAVGQDGIPTPSQALQTQQPQQPVRPVSKFGGNFRASSTPALPLTSASSQVGGAQKRALTFTTVNSNSSSGGGNGGGNGGGGKFPKTALSSTVPGNADAPQQPSSQLGPPPPERASELPAASQSDAAARLQSEALKAKKEAAQLRLKLSDAMKQRQLAEHKAAEKEGAVALLRSNLSKTERHLHETVAQVGGFSHSR
jgi:hypothetical protein